MPPSQKPERPLLIPSTEGEDAGSNNNANADAPHDSDDSLFVYEYTLFLSHGIINDGLLIFP